MKKELLRMIFPSYIIDYRTEISKTYWQSNRQCFRCYKDSDAPSETNAYREISNYLLSPKSQSSDSSWILLDIGQMFH